ncbi:MAG: hypothetical protein ABIJ84_04295 [bacterium]
MMNLLSSNNKTKIQLFIEFLSIFLIGSSCFMYSLWIPPYTGPNFSEIHIDFPFFDFPVFIGEIVLFVLLLFLLIKLQLFKNKIKLFHIFIAFFTIFILFKALSGYLNWGALALRNAAMFYYFLFAVVSFNFFNKNFFKNRFIVIATLLLLIIPFILGKVGNFSGFTYCCLIIALSLNTKNKFLKIISMSLGFYFITSFLKGGSKGFFISCWLGLIFMLGAFIYLYIKSNKIKKNRIISVLSLFGFVLVFLFFNINPHDLKRFKIWSNISYIMDEYSRHIEYIKPYASFDDIPYRGKKYDFLLPRYVKPRLYEDENFVKESMGPIKKKMKDEKKPTRPQALLQEIDEAKKDIKSYLDSPQTEEDRTKLKNIFEFLNNNIEPIKQEALKITSSSSSPKKNIKDIKEALGKMKSSSEKIASIENTDTIDEVEKIYKDLETMFPEQPAPIKEFRSPQSDVNTILWRLFLWGDILDEMMKKKTILGIDFGKPLRSPTMEKLRYLTGTGWCIGDWLGWLEPHNSYIHILYRAGIVGLIFIVSIWYFFIKMFIGFLKNNSYKGIVLSAAIFSYLIHVNFVVFLELPRLSIPFWCLAGFTYAYGVHIKKKVN